MMKMYRASIVLTLMCLWLQPALVPAAPGTSHLRVILLVDNSGSMKVNDPTGLRFTGVRLLASLLDPGDALGIILFATDATALTGRIVTLDSREAVSSLLAGLLSSRSK